MMKPLGLGYQKIGMCQTSACCIIFKMQSWLSVEHVRMLVINPELVEDELLSYIENLDNSQSHLDCKGYSCHQRLLNTWHDIIHMTWWMEWWWNLKNILKLHTLIFIRIKKHASWVMYKWIQSIQVIFCSLFLLADDTYGLQLSTRDVYETRVPVFIYSHTQF
jgi:hypothetical protein